MDRISELKDILSGFCHWNKARIDCFARMLVSLLKVRTVNLREIAVGFESTAEIESRYRRLKRFFSGFEFDRLAISKWLFTLFRFEEEPYYVIIDRTNWFWGKGKINILMLSIAYEGIAIPIHWMLLKKSGNASATEHIELLKEYLSYFGNTNIAGVLGDREFASGKLFKWLTKKQLPFYIRIKENSITQIKQKKFAPAKKLFRHLQPKQQTQFNMTVWLFDTKVYLAGARSERGELMIVATNQCPKNAIAIYLRRWEIEVLFQSLKSRGFRFEETHMTHPQRIDKLMALLAIGFAWAHKVGEWRALCKPIILNQYVNMTRPQFSFFRYGLDFLRNLFLQHKTSDFKQLLKLITLPKAILNEVLL